MSSVAHVYSFVQMLKVHHKRKQAKVCAQATLKKTTIKMHARCAPPKQQWNAQARTTCVPHTKAAHLHTPHMTHATPHAMTTLSALADLSTEVGTEFTLAPAAVGLALLGAGASVLAARAAVYARLQYVVAALLGNRIPPTATTVLQLCGSARDLYYYPRTVTQVTVVDPAAKPGGCLGWSMVLIGSIAKLVVLSNCYAIDIQHPPNSSVFNHTPLFTNHNQDTGSRRG